MEKKVIEVIERDILELFKFHQDDLFNLRVDHGIRYLERRFDGDAEMIARLRQHPIFWQWWVELWAERDRQLYLACCPRFGYLLYTYRIDRDVKLRNGDSYTPTETRRIPYDDAWEFYCKFHNPDRIKFYPNYVLVNQCLKKRQDSNSINLLNQVHQ